MDCPLNAPVHKKSESWSAGMAICLKQMSWYGLADAIATSPAHTSLQSKLVSLPVRRWPNHYRGSPGRQTRCSWTNESKSPWGHITHLTSCDLISTECAVIGHGHRKLNRVPWSDPVSRGCDYVIMAHSDEMRSHKVTWKNTVDP